jgi:hypothetical protein
MCSPKFPAPISLKQDLALHAPAVPVHAASCGISGETRVFPDHYSISFRQWMTTLSHVHLHSFADSLHNLAMRREGAASSSISR